MKYIVLAAGLILTVAGMADPAAAQQNTTQPQTDTATPNAMQSRGNATEAARANHNRGDNNNSQDHMDAEARGNGQAPTGADANQPARSTQKPDR